MARAEPGRPGGASAVDGVARLRDLAAARLGIAASTIDPAERLHRYGLTSLLAAGLVADIAAMTGRALPPTLVWDHPTLDRLAAWLDGAAEEEGPPPPCAMPAGEAVAITGLACRLPGAASPAAFWSMLLDGIDAVGEVPADRWDAAGLTDADPGAPGRMRTSRGGFLADVAGFDAAFFGLSPREAAQADPQQRLALELAWEALEDAGIRASRLNGSRAGVFLGAMWSDYARLLADATGIAAHTATGQDTSIISARIAHALGLMGPAITVNTACSSALVAVHQACRSLRAGESTVALAGGVHLVLSPESSIAMTKFGAMAPDGRCKAFDAAADGYVRGEGGAILVLEPLSAARAAGRRVFAIIRGGAINNDGPSNGLTAPNPAAQRAMLRDALADAGLAPQDVDYVEAHGTGTALGDPIEANALGTVLGQGRALGRKLRIGSVKTNIGHLEAAAGAAGLAKLALALRHRRIPRSLHFHEANHAIDMTGIAIQSEATPWPSRADGRAIGGVSAFGFGGTNCHLLLEGPPPEAAAASPPVFVFAGNGAAWPGMARGLMASAAFAESLLASDALLRGLGFPASVVDVLADARVEEVALGQPAHTAYQIALADLLASLGIRPVAVIGHSLGEVAAACIAGALTREQALHLAMTRSALQAGCAGQGTMAVAAASAAALGPLLPSDVEIAGENGPTSTVLSGPAAGIEAAMALLDAQGITALPVRVPVAYHSAQMEPLVPRLVSSLAGLSPQAGTVPFISTVTGTVVPGTSLDARYWGRNLRQPVLFRQGIAALAAAGHRHFLELGPHPLLALPIRQTVPDATVAAPLRRGTADEATLRSAIGTPVQERHGPHLLVLSARSAMALEALAQRWADHLDSAAATAFPDLCHTALVGRDRFAHRLALQASDAADAAQRLRTGRFRRGIVPAGATPPFAARRDATESREAFLDRCAAAFVTGAEIEAALNEGGRIADAPTYPFEREPHWLPRPASGLSYALAWQPLPAPIPTTATALPHPAITAPPPDEGLEAEATVFARQALAATPAIAPAHRDLAARLAAWSPLPPLRAADGPAARLLRQVGAALPDILAGRAGAVEALFAGGDTEAAAAVYASPPFAAAQHALADAVASHAAGRAVRVLEIGAGTGALTAALLPRLPAGSQVTATDVTPAFLAALRRRFGDGLSTGVFDLDDPAGVEGPFDVIVAANAVHAAARLGPALAALRARLAPGGLLALAELARAPRWVDLVFGITEGWWRFRGDELRPAHALLGAEAWLAALSDAGFAPVAALPDGDAHLLVLARAPAAAPRFQVQGDAALAGTLGIAHAPDAVAILWCPVEAPPAQIVEEAQALAARGLPITLLARPGLAGAAAIGAARGIALDQPGSIAAIIHLDDTAPETLSILGTSLGTARGDLRARAGRLDAMRLLRVEAAGRALRPDIEALHVIAGGTGRLGLAFAHGLARQGARHLLLVGRRSPDPATLPPGARYLALDLTAPDAAPRLAAAMDRRPGLVIHAAGIADGSAEAVMMAKIGIADVLAAAIPDPDGLLLFSSAAGIWGVRDRLAYAAANHALDEWARLARARGLPATSIAFGRFTEKGLLSPTEDAALDAAGMLAMPPADAFAAALEALAAGEALRVVARIDWSCFAGSYAARRDAALFEHLLPRSAPPAPRPVQAPPRSTRLDRDGLAALVADLLGHADARRLDPEAGLFEQGLDSLLAVSLRRRIEEAAGVPIPAALLFAQPSIARLADWLAGQARAVPNAPASMDAGGGPIAVIGLAGRFPGGAEDPDALLAQLLAGQDAVRPLPAGRPGAPHVAGWLDGIDLFDAAFFGIAPRDAAAMDPQQRLLLEAAWHALEAAGIAPDSVAGGRVGVFLGATGSDYAALARRQAEKLDALSLTGQPSNTLAGRIAYQLGLHGPALVVDTACSSSLVALHLAVQSLRRGEAEMALAGGVNLILAPEDSAMLARAGLLSPTGRCATFDAAADGYVRAEGVGIAVLKTLARALADGDRVLAVIRGSAVNHDGRSSSFTAPNGAAQSAVIRAALADAGLDATAIDYVEAHGTGTALGDPVEMDALAEVFAGRATALPIGALKASIGHAEAAAGIAGLAKVTAMLGSGTIPPQPHFRRANQHASAMERLLVPTAATRFAAARPRAGLSAFGASGTNAHLVLEAPPPPPTARGEGPPRLLLSAATPAALEALRQSVLARLRDGTFDFEDACHTAWIGRARLRHWLLADSAAALASAPLQQGTPPAIALPRGRRVALPPTPFTPQRHWLDEAAAAPSWLLPPPVRSARSGEAVSAIRLDAAAPWLADHVVDGAILVPATAFLAFAFASGAQALDDVTLLRPLPVPPGGLEAQFVQDRDGALSLHAELPDGWTMTASARTASARTASARTASARTGTRDGEAPAPPAGAAAWDDGDAIAQELAARGFRFGPLYRRITALRRGTDAAEARLAPADALDPMLLDAAIQTLTALLPMDDQPWLPQAIASAWRGAPPEGALLARARLTALEDGAATGDAALLRDDGAVVAMLRGITLRRAAATPGAWQHDIAWRPAPEPALPLAGHWHAIGAEAATLGTGSVDAQGSAPLPACDGIIDLRPLAATDPAACIAAVVALVRDAAALSPPPQLILVSRGAATAPPLAPGAVPAAAILGGLLGSIAAEHPALRCRWIDIDPDEPGIPAALAGPPGRFALRHGLLLAPEISRTAPPAATAERIAPAPDHALTALRRLPVPSRPPGAGEVAIAIDAAGLNFKDTLVALGRVEGDTLGLEAAGRVLAMGPGVEGFATGDPVIAFAPGLLAGEAVVPAHRVVMRPDWLPPDAAASLPVATLTAWRGLHDLAGVAPGMRVLVHAGAGGVGAAAIALARQAGARVFATASAGKRPAALAAGAEAVADSRSTDFAVAAREWAGAEGFDIVLHALSPAMAAASAALLRPGGVFLEIGSAAAPAAPHPIRHIAYELEAPLAADPGWFADRMARILALLRDGAIALPRRSVMPMALAEEAFQSLAQGRVIGRIVLRPPQPPRIAGTWLVTGGGTVGTAIADWLAAQGATRIVIASRSATATRHEAASVDVSDRAALASLLASLPDLRGIVHAAGVVRDGIIGSLSPADIEATLAAKVDGARHLDALTRGLALDHFLLVSSTAASLEAPGQAAYAGANAWLDRLAAARRASGLPALSVAFGPWAGGMFAALPAAQRARLEGQGFRPMAPRRAAAALGQAIGSGAVHRLVMDRMAERRQPQAADLRAELHAAPAEGRALLLQAVLSRRILGTLGLPPETPVAPDRALRDLGLDSLLSVSLRNELAGALALDLPSTLLFDHPTLSALADHLLGALGFHDLDAMDEAELAALLAQELAAPA
ncbi:beta-ketoacyl synthase N-terminal-like domain-containing protein [Falsiroseomonas sp.]|uniref:beta-ketoacyl synthase N-terminal-like domain-containing protein n=1 Tax=Falsiroseomonas sp. TaxID=2870721 RepID=UPI003F709D86